MFVKLTFKAILASLVHADDSETSASTELSSKVGNITTNSIVNPKGKTKPKAENKKPGKGRVLGGEKKTTSANDDDDECWCTCKKKETRKKWLRRLAKLFDEQGSKKNNNNKKPWKVRKQNGSERRDEKKDISEKKTKQEVKKSTTVLEDSMFETKNVPTEERGYSHERLDINEKPLPLTRSKGLKEESWSRKRNEDNRNTIIRDEDNDDDDIDDFD